ncbi:unnamed protein product [Soboliphyme baturini]|uniref:TAXi_C domain-containing protein n=1 Tax=Soboliphyme baturini TaxID=241478 RepID=A0A183IWL9_9BILA|nr:unnamed protein product [Soboliphyme baturini]
MTTAEQNLLLDGHLLIGVALDGFEPSDFLGCLIPKQTCDVHQGILSRDLNLSNTTDAGSISSGYAIIDVLKNGSLKYDMEVNGVDDKKIYGLVIEREIGRNRKKLIAGSEQLIEFSGGMWMTKPPSPPVRFPVDYSLPSLSRATCPAHRSFRVLLSTATSFIPVCCLITVRWYDHEVRVFPDVSEEGVPDEMERATTGPLSPYNLFSLIILHIDPLAKINVFIDLDVCAV